MSKIIVFLALILTSVTWILIANVKDFDIFVMDFDICVIDFVLCLVDLKMSDTPTKFLDINN